MNSLICPFNMLVTISEVFEAGRWIIVVEIQDGGYNGKFYYDEHGYVGAIEIYNPPQ